MARDADQAVAATRIVFEPSLVYLPPRPFRATQQVPSPSRSGSHRLCPLTATIVFRMCHE